MEQGLILSYSITGWTNQHSPALPTTVGWAKTSLSTNQGVSSRTKLTWKTERETKETSLEACVFFSEASVHLSQHRNTQYCWWKTGKIKWPQMRQVLLIYLTSSFILWVEKKKVDKTWWEKKSGTKYDGKIVSYRHVQLWEQSYCVLRSAAAASILYWGRGSL